MQFVVVADDLSGAAELGALALRLGLTAEVQTDFDSATPADVCLVDTDSRWCSAEMAVRRVTQVARRLIAVPNVLVYKKVDSLLRGPVLAEVQALARTLGRSRAVLIPANPSRGRIIRGGQYLVHGVPLDQSALADDPEYPRRTANVRELLADERVGRLPPAISDGVAATNLVVPDIQSPEDLQRWAAEVDPATLPAGAADFFAALVARQLGQAPADATHGDPARRGGTGGNAGRTLLVCGSAAAWPLRFAANQRRLPPWPCSLAPRAVFAAGRNDRAIDQWGHDIARQLRDHDIVLVGLGQPQETAPVGGSAPAASLVRRLAAAVATAMAQVPVRHLFLEGGATAAAIVRQFGWHRLRVTDSAGPGVAMLESLVSNAADAPILYVKPGTYAWPDGMPGTC